MAPRRRGATVAVVRRPGRTTLLALGIGAVAAGAAATALVLVGRGGGHRRPTAVTPRPRPAPPPGPVRLANVRGGGGWVALLRGDVVARGAPTPGAAAVLAVNGRNPYSGDRQALMVTGAYRARSGRHWLRVLVPARPNGASGWIPRSAVASMTERRVVVRAHLAGKRVEVWRDGRRVAAWPAGIGRSATPTPTGRFAVYETVAVPAAEQATYGRYIVALTAHSDVVRLLDGQDPVVAFHGTGAAGAVRLDAPSSLGCLILADAPLAALTRLAPPGTPVEILPA